MKRIAILSKTISLPAVAGLFFLTSVMSLFLAGCKNTGENTTPYQTNIFPMVKVPVAFSTDKKLSTEYITRHYWDEFLSEDRLLRLKPDTSTILGISPQLFDESFAGYVSAISSVDDTIAHSSITRLVDKAVKMAEDGYQPLFIQIIQSAEKYLFDAHSPYLNDELYLPVLDGISRCSVTPNQVKDSYRWQMAICNKNRVGTTAADFRYASSTGRQSMMSAINSEYLLIFFNDPDCPNCRQVLEDMKKADPIINLVNMGVLKVLAVSPDGKTQLWDERQADFPKEWIYAYDPSGLLNQGTIYSLRTSPSIYLLDSDKKVVVKDASLPHALRVLSSIAEHYVMVHE